MHLYGTLSSSKNEFIYYHTVFYFFFYSIPVSRWNGPLLFSFRDAKVEVKKGEMISRRLRRCLVASLGQKFCFFDCQHPPLFFICLLHPVTQLFTFSNGISLRGRVARPLPPQSPLPCCFPVELFLHLSSYCGTYGGSRLTCGKKTF